MKRDAGPDRLGDLIDPALRNLGVRGRVRDEQVRAVFAQVVGPALSSMCRAERLKRGALVVATSNTALAHQLQLDSVSVINGMNSRLDAPVVRRLRFVPM